MTEERRQGHIEFGEKLDDHINSFNTHVARFDEFEERVITEIAGEKHVDIVGEVYYRGGIQGDVGEVKLALARLEHKANNGGVNARPVFTTAQKAAIWVIALPATASALVGMFALLQAIAERL